ncbi:hypothetical protein BpHYR1_049261 [Brachionus plicatilis]|uniref:Uncharacterized protein n=1 Tax=Brachionus plicatilis TaxID=10195 RepID=A0A3M7R777_BRAPC|nr:hypothetical protein BpHYR1_049261 [Brachionus plicatilis]
MSLYLPGDIFLQGKKSKGFVMDGVDFGPDWEKMNRLQYPILKLLNFVRDFLCCYEQWVLSFSKENRNIYLKDQNVLLVSFFELDHKIENYIFRIIYFFFGYVDSVDRFDIIQNEVIIIIKTGSKDYVEKKAERYAHCLSINTCDEVETERQIHDRERGEEKRSNN